jgi:hypothetical protein
MAESAAFLAFAAAHRRFSAARAFLFSNIAIKLS